MTERPRGFWQIHLSTAVVMMLVGAGCMGLNANGSIVHPDVAQLVGDVYPPSYQPPRVYGWPLVAHPTVIPPAPMIMWRWNYTNLIVNICVALGLVVTSAGLVEFLVRRRLADPRRSSARDHRRE
jgi:hypothetical protein